MKFSQTLSTHLTPEWRQQYIAYRDLKQMLINVIENAPRWSDAQSPFNYYEDFDELFFQRCESELTKVNTFFAEKVAEAKRKLAALRVQLRVLMDNINSLSFNNHKFNTTQKKLMSELKFAFSELYLSIVLLQNYQTMNHTGFRKILKKHDKFLRTTNGLKWFTDNVDTSPLYTNRELMQMIHEIEEIFTHQLEGGDRSRAMKRLRVPPLADVQHPWTTFRLGFFLGAFLVLALATIYLWNTIEHKVADNNLQACIHLHRGPFLLILFLFLLGVNIFGWRKAGVNHILIFEIEPRDHLTAMHVMHIAAFFAVIWCLSIMGMLCHRSLGIAPFVFPFVLSLLMLFFMLNPFPIWHYTSRMWLLRTTTRVVSAPFFPVGFADFWLGDQLNSLNVCLIDYKYILCFYLTNWSWSNAQDPERCMEKDFIFTPIVLCLPAWFRFAQCLRRYHDTKEAFPFLINAGKYFSSFPTVIFATLSRYHKADYANSWENPYFWTYLIFAIIQTIYCCAWDLLMDFGLFKTFTGENVFLREEILYPRAFYYFAIVENMLLRLQWTYNIYWTRHLKLLSYYSETLCSYMEVFRRYLWNYIRLEHEHVYNAGKFRAVRDISVMPIEIDNEDSLLRMMDEYDGIKNRRSSSYDSNEELKEE